MKATRSALSELHWPLVGLVVSIAVLGCYNLHSAAAGHDGRLWLTQLGWFGCGLAVCMAAVSVDYRLSESVAYLVYAVACVLLLAVLVGGRQSMGARRWLNVGLFAFQPSEVAKVATILCMARYFSHRSELGGYSIGALVRPLNPSRPLACMALLVVHWHKPLLADPVGLLARGIHSKLAGSTPALEDLLWFRCLLIGSLTLGVVAALVSVVRAERAASLLHPWPPQRRRQVLTGLGLLYAISLGLLAWQWQAPLLQDPFGVLITSLDAQAQPGGRYALLRPGMGLRLALVALTGSYFTASVLAVRRGLQQMVDLLVAPMDLLALPALLTLVQPDLGTAGIIILVGMSIILIVGVRGRSLIMMGFGAALVSAVAWFGILKDYQKRRILTFIDPEQDLRGAGWNAVQSLIAVGSGRWLGKGHMGGTQTQLSFLPEQHTDFAFSVWAEEQGFLGCFILLLLYLLLLSFALSIAADARDSYGALLATGVASMVLWQAIINVGMVIGVLPVVGLTLPLFSYGGSSLLTVMLGIGLLLNVHWRRRGGY